MGERLKQILKCAAEGNNGNQTTGFGAGEASRPAEQGNGRSREEQDIVEIIHSGTAQPCFGGYLFRRTMENGGLIFSFAVQDMDSEEIQLADQRYLRFNAIDPKGFLSYWKCQRFQQYTVFNFFCSDRQTLRERLKAGDKKYSAEVLMMKLLMCLNQYQGSLVGNNMSYYPLNCLTLDTVLLDTRGELFILPLMPHKGHYPIEVPREVSLNNGGSIKSDLFSTAYVSMEYVSGGDGADVKLQKPRTPIILECLQVVPDWRPSLEHTYKVLQAVSGGGKIKAPISSEFGNLNPRKQPATPSDTPTVPVAEYDYEPVEKKTSGKVMEKIKKATRKVVDFLSVEERETDIERDDTFGQDQDAGYGYYRIEDDSDDDDELTGEV